MGDPRVSSLEGFVDELAGRGEWSQAVTLARSVLTEYEMEAEADPAGYAALVERARARLRSLLDEAEAEGAETEPRPSAFARSYVAADNASRAPDTAALARAAEFDDHIRDARLGRKRVHPTVDAVIAECADLPTSDDRELARKSAVQSALGRALGQKELAVSAAGETGRRIADETDLDAVDDGYAAYCGLTVAEWFRERKEPHSVQRVASRAMDRFVEHRALLTPARIPDLVRCGLVLGEALVQLGRWGEARQVLGDVAFVADQLDTSLGGPVGDPGSMPPGWGLPVVPTAKEWKATRKRLHKLHRS
jgi:hypothetical protein